MDQLGPGGTSDDNSGGYLHDMVVKSYGASQTPKGNAPVAPPAPSVTPVTPVGPGKPSGQPPPTVTASAAKTTPLDPTSAQADADADKQSISQAAQTATSCCNDPTSCLSDSEQTQVQQNQSSVASVARSAQQPGTTPAINSSCNQQQAAANANAQNNGIYSNVCYRNQSTCTSTCSTLLTKYNNLVKNCGSCDSLDVYQSMVSYITSQQATCSQLSANSSAAANQSFASSAGSDGGANCAAAAGGGVPSSNNAAKAAAAAAESGDPYGCAADPKSSTCVQCSSSPNSPQCRALADANPANVGKDGLLQPTSNANNPSAFNVGNFDGVTPQTDFGGGGGNKGNNKADLIPNNTGGSIPGGTGGSASLANLQGGKRPSPGSPGYSTDIEQGLRAGGGYSNPVGSDTSGANGRMARAGGGGRGPASASMDLRNYLPGGSLDPNGAAGMNAHSGEIAGKFADMWRSVSVRIQEKCRLGELVDCR